MNFTAQDFDTMARTIWGEGRGEPWIGQIAIGFVIKNRTETPRRWRDTIHATCRQRYQFSCWLIADPNRALILKLDAMKDLSFRIALAAAAVV
jgi:N-acetylmuramoyl-L-alanine amidase